MKIWVDDIRPAPNGYVWVKSVNEAKQKIYCLSEFRVHSDRLPLDEIELVDLDHDAGDYASDGGDYIELLKWLEETGRNYPIRIHSMNPVGVQNMRAIINHNNWTEIF